MGGEHSPATAVVPPVRTSLRLVWLAALVYAVAAATQPGGAGRHLAAAVLTGTTALGWAAWLTAQHHKNMGLSIGGVAVLAASGGVLVLFSPIGVAVVGIAGMCAAALLTVVPAAVITSPGVIAAAIAVGVTGHPAAVIGGAASGAAAGLVVGMGRRQAQERVRQDAELALARQRSEIEHDRAEVLAERNRIAREVHDVLAHTLSALSVQMEAIGSLMEDGAGATQVRAAVARSRGLVTEGLEETRRAVRVLRDEPVDVVEQVASLAAAEGSAYRLDGSPRSVAPAAGLALVRVAQEALTNARKHAAGAVVGVELLFAADSVELTVANIAGVPSGLASTGAGYGLQGMRERIELVGGSLTAGPHDGGWRVRAVVPA
jgi:signal transduction histidine kinase